MIVQRQDRATYGTAEPGILSVANKDANAFPLTIEDHLLDRPRPFEREQFREDVDVAHGEKSSMFVPMRIL